MTVTHTKLLSISGQLERPSDDDLLTTDEFCRLARIGKSTAERWRTLGGPDYPPFIKYPGKKGRVTYSRKVVMAWLASRGRLSTSEPG